MSSNKNKRLAINMLASIITYLVIFGISFILSPFIVEHVGVEAYGFVNLANNFVTYASLTTIALNSLAGRFITIKIFEKDIEGANKYFSSVFLANGLIGLVLLIVLTVIWFKLEAIINIPTDIFWDVKILFASLFINCLISTIGSIFTVSTFATNKLYYNSLRELESNIFRALVLFVLFTLCSPRIYYLGITALFVGIYCLVYNIRYTHLLLPYIKIKTYYFDFKAVKELVASGVWNLITRLGQILNDGLDLLITNILIDATSMGILSIAKTIPGMISSVVGMLVGVFSPNFTALYAEKKFDELVKAVKQSMKIMGIIANIPIIALVVCGYDFFSLWQPSLDAKILFELALLSCASYIINGGINCIYDVFTVVNKLKVNSIVTCVSASISVLLTMIIVTNTDLSIYAVAGVSTIIISIKNIFIVIPYGAKCLRMEWYGLYFEVFRHIFYVIACSSVCYVLLNTIRVNNYIELILKAGITVIISTVIGFYVFLDKVERKRVFSMVKRND